MSFLTKARDLFGRVRSAPTLSTSVVAHDPIDEYVFDDLKQHAPRFKDAMTAKPMLPTADGGQAEFEIAPDMWADLFHSHHNVAPNTTLNEAGGIKPSHQIVRQVMEHYVETDDFKKLKALTRGDGEVAGMTAMRAQQVLIDELEQGALKEHAEQAQRMADQENAIAQAQTAGDAIREQIKDDGGQPTPEQIQALKDAAQQKADARQELGGLIEQQDASGLDVAAAEAVQHASEAANEVAQVWTSLPGNETGTPTRIPPDKALELALRWRDGDSLQRIALMAGRIARDMRAARRRNVKGGRDERIGIKTGNDLSLLVPSQLVKLTNPALKRAFFKDFVDRKLLIYDTIGIEEQGRGPQVILKDVSGSMKSPDATKHEWATAAAMALIGLAQREGRPCYVVNFDSKVTGEFDLGRAPNLPTLTDMACHFTGGGTRILTALAKAAELIDKHADYAKADIVLICDGQDNHYDGAVELRDRLREKGVLTHGVMIGGAAQGFWFDEFCDTAASVFDTSGPNDTTKELAVATA